MRLSSFGRSFLDPRFSDSASLRRVVRCFVAARRRWPSGRLVAGPGTLRWMVDGSCGVLVDLWPSWNGGWRARVCTPGDLRREIALFGLDVPSSGPRFWREWVSVAWSALRG